MLLLRLFRERSMRRSQLIYRGSESSVVRIIRGSLGQDGNGRFVCVPGIKLWQQPRPCAWCGEPFTVKYVQAAKTRFCGRSCSAKWRMRQPEIVARVHTAEIHARIGAKVSTWLRETPKGRRHAHRFAA